MKTKLAVYVMACLVAIALECLSGCAPAADVEGAYAAAKARVVVPVEAPKPQTVIVTPVKGRSYRMNANGEREYLTEAEEAELERELAPMTEEEFAEFQRQLRSELKPFPDPAFSGFLPPDPTQPTAPVVELYVISASWCGPCREVHDAAGGLTGITFIDVDELPDEVLRINGEIPPSFPCFVRMVDGVRVDRWLGATDRAGIIAMRDGKA